MTWAKIVLLLLQGALALVEFLKRKDAMDAGFDKAVAKAAAAILVKTNVAKETLAAVTRMSEEQVDQALKELEP